MRFKSTLVGLLVLAVVAAGVFLARGRSSTPASEETMPPDVTLADGTAAVGGIRITLSVKPSPPVALARFRARVRAETNGSPVAIENGRVSFEMAMPMGDHRYTLVPDQDGWLEAEVVLPRCMSGDRRWYATVEGSVAGRPVTARFRLDLAPPPSNPARGGDSREP